MKNAWFLVKFTEVGIVPGSLIKSFLNREKLEVTRMEHARQAMDIINRSALLAIGMKTFGRSPRAFYFGLDQQMDLLSRNLQGMFQDNVS